MIARGSSLFGHAGSSGKGGNFVETVLAKAGAGEALAIVDDVTMSPTGARDMAERIVLLLEREAPPGTYHLANAGGCSWFEFAAAILDLAGLPADLGRRSSRGDVVQRPRCSVLLDTKSTSLGLPPARPWREALAWYLANRPAAARTGASAPVRPAP
jgi:dTDP-4-dehydrorhamnose reductase